MEDKVPDLSWNHLVLDFGIGLGLALWQLFNSCVCTQILDCSQWETRGLNIILICYKNIARSLWQVFRIVMSPALCLLMRIFPWRRRSGAVTRCITWADTSTTISYYTDTFYLTFSPQTYSSSLSPLQTNFEGRHGWVRWRMSLVMNMNRSTDGVFMKVSTCQVVWSDVVSVSRY